MPELAQRRRVGKTCLFMGRFVQPDGLEKMHLCPLFYADVLTGMRNFEINGWQLLRIMERFSYERILVQYAT